MAIVWYLLDATGSALAAGGVAVATIVGRAIGSLAAAILIDRFRARRVMLSSDLWRLLTLGIAGLWIDGHHPSPPELSALALAVAIGGGCFNPARASAVPEIVRREHLVHANALDAVSGGVVAALGWALGGIVVAAIGPGPALLVDAGTFLGSYVLVGAARWDAPEWPRVSRIGPVRRTVAAVQAASGDSLTRTVLAIETAHAVAMGVFLAALPAFIRDLGGDAALYGLQGGLFWAGVVAASTALAFRPWHRVGRLYGAGVTLNAIGNLLVALAHGAASLLGAVFMAGLGWPAWRAGLHALLQAHAPASTRGATFAGLEAVPATAMIPGWLVGGWAADQFGARAVIASAPLVHLVLGISLWLVPGVRQFTLDEAPPSERMR